MNSTSDLATRLDAEVAQVCGVLNQSHAQLVELVGQVMEAESWAGPGLRSPEHWLMLRGGLAPSRAREVVAVAGRKAELPAVFKAFEEGQLSLDQVVAVARYTPAAAQASAAELALNATVPQLRRVLSRYAFDPEPPAADEPRAADQPPAADEPRAADQPPAAEAGDERQVANPSPTASDHGGALGDSPAAAAGKQEPTDSPDDATDAEPSAATPGGAEDGWVSDAAAANAPPDPQSSAARAMARARLSTWLDEHGRFHLRFDGPPDLGALIEAALAEAKDALFRDGHPDPTLADALVEIATRSMGAVRSVSRRDAFRVYVHLDTDGGWLHGKPRLPKHLLELLTCDGVLQPVWHTGGSPVNVGRALRIAPDRTRRLCEDRDRGCRYPACTCTSNLENHHLIQWLHGGETNMESLASLCPFHHRSLHAGEYTITGNANEPDGLIFTTAAGFPIGPGPSYTTPDEPPPPCTYSGPTGEPLIARWVTLSDSTPPSDAPPGDAQPADFAPGDAPPADCMPADAPPAPWEPASPGSASSAPARPDADRPAPAERATGRVSTAA